MNKDELVSVMKKHGDNQADLAEYIGISLQRFNAKINGTGGARFDMIEVGKIRKKYNLTDGEVVIIFLQN